MRSVFADHLPFDQYRFQAAKIAPGWACGQYKGVSFIGELKARLANRVQLSAYHDPDGVWILRNKIPKLQN